MSDATEKMAKRLLTPEANFFAMSSKDSAGIKGEVIITQDLFVYEMLGEDAQGKIKGQHRSTRIGRPKFWDRARYYGEEQRLAAALDASEGA